MENQDLRDYIDFLRYSIRVALGIVYEKARIGQSLELLRAVDILKGALDYERYSAKEEEHKRFPEGKK